MDFELGISYVFRIMSITGNILRTAVIAFTVVSAVHCRATEEKALAEKLYVKLSESQRPAIEFLLSNMPQHDVNELSVEYLAENIEYAYKAQTQFLWAKDAPEDIFLNYVLPYVCLDEKRDPWRKKFYTELQDIVAGCKTCGEVAVKLNTTIFDKYNVHYSRERSKPNQSPMEAIAEGKSSCTGLSIFLVDACRALGVPARVVGTQMWVSVPGNHTWVEVWDNGWHFLGASESKALDNGWFARRASEQIEGDFKHAIYAVSFKETGKYFPLVWAKGVTHVPAIDVTARYASKKTDELAVSEVEKMLAKKKLVELHDDLSGDDKMIAVKDIDKVTALIWHKYADEISVSADRQKEHQEKAITYNGKTMRYKYKVVGDKSEGGYPLYIALHGGGGAPARVNDSQWQQMQVYYVKGVKAGIYLAPRGVTDTWNLHWVPESFVCYDRIIENMIVFEGVDANRVYLMGYSAGGDATYQIPARAADRWAAVAMSAGHPNGVPVDNYASLGFLIQVGSLDSAYKRNKVAAEYGVKLDELHVKHPELYKHATYIHAGRGHGFMDHDPEGKAQEVFADCKEWLDKGEAAATTNVNCNSIHWLDQFTRDPHPTTVIWDCATTRDRSGSSEDGFWPTDQKDKLHYWLGLDRYDKDTELESKRIVAAYDKTSNKINVSEIGNFVRLYLDSEMIDLTKEVAVEVNGKSLKAQPKVSLRVLVQTLLDRGDPNYIFPACLTLSKNPEGNWMLE